MEDLGRGLEKLGDILVNMGDEHAVDKIDLEEECYGWWGFL